jgi:hypothetical protein
VSFVSVRVSHRVVRSICRFCKPPRTGEVLPILFDMLVYFFVEVFLAIASLPTPRRVATAPTRHLHPRYNFYSRSMVIDYIHVYIKLYT